MHLFLFHMFSLLETGYLLSAGNVLRTSPKIWHVKEETFRNSIALAVINKDDQGVLVQISTVFGPVYHTACRRASKTELFKHLSNHVLRVRNFGSTKSMRAIFVSKCSRFNLYFKNAAKNSEKVFCF